MAEKVLKLDAKATSREYVNKQGLPTSFLRVTVVLNGIECEFKPADNTTRELLKFHFENGTK